MTEFSNFQTRLRIKPSFQPALVRLEERVVLARASYTQTLTVIDDAHQPVSQSLTAWFDTSNTTYQAHLVSQQLAAKSAVYGLAPAISQQASSGSVDVLQGAIMNVVTTENQFLGTWDGMQNGTLSEAPRGLNAPKKVTTATTNQEARDRVDVLKTQLTILQERLKEINDSYASMSAFTQTLTSAYYGWRITSINGDLQDIYWELQAIKEQFPNR